MLSEGYEIRAVAEGDAAAAGAAYRRNREHLAPWDPDRPEEFWTDAGQEAEVARKVAAAQEGRTHAFHLWHRAPSAPDGAGEQAEEQVVGGSMLTNVVRGHMQSAVAGYWVDHAHQGRGLATAMTAHLVEQARDLGLHRLEAGTMLANLASQRVLERSGFHRIGVAEGLLFVQGAWRDHVLFQRLLHDDPLT